MFSIPTPVVDREHFEHYVKLLGRSSKFSWLPERLAEFVELERQHDGNFDGFRHSNRARLTQHFHEIYEQMGDSEKSFPAQGFKKCDTLLSSVTEEAVFLSIDMKSANYTAFKLLDHSDEFLPPVGPGIEEEWAQLLDSVGIHPFFAKSKGFRQVAFGKFIPNRLMSIEKHVMTRLREHITEFCPQMPIVRALHDEIVIKFNNKDEAQEEIVKLMPVINSFSYRFPLSMVRFHKTWFKMEPIGRVIRMLDDDGEVVLGKCNPKDRWHVKRKLDNLCSHVVSSSLYGVPSTMFYPAFRSAVLGEPVELLDREFTVDGQVARWTFEG